MPSCALSRTDPPSGKNGFSTNQGFTVIELMMAIAVLAIVTSLALPSYRAIVEKRRVTSGAEQIMAFLSTAQMEAVKRNQFVALNYEAGDNWCFGLVAGDVADDTACDCSDGSSCTLDGELRVLNSALLRYPEVLRAADVGEDGLLVFDPVRGLTVNGQTAEVQLLSPDEASYALNIEITPTGRTKICSDTGRASNPVPGYEECP